MILFYTGLGAVDFPPANGAAATARPLARTQIPIVTIGGAAAEPAFSGLAPGLAGLHQINLRVPQIAPRGVAGVVITQAGIAGPPAPLQIN